MRRHAVDGLVEAHRHADRWSLAVRKPADVRRGAWRVTGTGRRQRWPSDGADPRLLQKLIRIVGCHRARASGTSDAAGCLAEPTPSQDEIDAFAGIFDALQPVAPEDLGTLWSISVNRQASTSVWRSRLTVKADAAARLFESKDHGHPVGGARHRDRRHAQGVPAAQRVNAARAQSRRPRGSAEQPGASNLRLSQNQGSAGSRRADTPVAGSAAARIDPRAGSATFARISAAACCAAGPSTGTCSSRSCAFRTRRKTIGRPASTRMAPMWRASSRRTGWRRRRNRH